MMSRARGFNPHFKEMYKALERIVDKHSDNLESVVADCRELTDEYGVYQVTPVISITFKG